MCHLTNDQSALERPNTGQIPHGLPLDSGSTAIYRYAAQQLQPTILNHSIRVYLHAYQLAIRENSGWAETDRLPVLFAACILHDVGTAPTHDGPQRFEVEGGDAAVAVVQDVNPSVSKADLHEIWVAIALHTSAGIAERITPLARLVRLSVLIDFKRPAALALTSKEAVDALESRFPRGDVEKVLGDTVVEQAQRRPEKAPPASWPGILLKSSEENPGWDGVNKAF